MIRLLIASAIFLFVLQLPIRRTSIGGSMRLLALFLGSLALLPAVVMGLLFPNSTPSERQTDFAVVIGILLVSLAAYGVMRLRERFGGSDKPDREFGSPGSGKKRVVPFPADDEDEDA